VIPKLDEKKKIQAEAARTQEQANPATQQTVGKGPVGEGTTQSPVAATETKSTTTTSGQTPPGGECSVQ
jgi:hypothetical protein